MKRLKIFSFQFYLSVISILVLLPISQGAISSVVVNSYTQGIGTLQFKQTLNKLGADSIRGKVKINDQFYTVICDCDRNVIENNFLKKF